MITYRTSGPARAAVLGLTGLALAAVSASGSPAEAAAAVTAASFSYTGDAYGTAANVGSEVTSGPSAPVTLGCTAEAGIARTNSTAGVDLGALGRSGTVTTTAGTFAGPARSMTTATSQSVRLLGGLVSAATIKAASATTRTSGGFSSSSSGTAFTKLVVAGKAVSSTATPNRRITISGFGYLVLNEQVARRGTSSASLTVNALHLVVTTENRLGIALGSNLVVSHATSGLSGPVAGVLDGNAYGTRLGVGNAVKSGPSFQVFLPCLGTEGALRSNAGSGVSLGTALTTGTLSNTARGSVSTGSATGETTSSVQSANLLRGVLKATVIKADANAAKAGSGFSFSDACSSFGTLSVNGHPEIGTNVAPNTTVALPGVGTLYLHRVIRAGNSVEVRMVELVTTSPVNGLPAGSDLRIAVAEASAH